MSDDFSFEKYATAHIRKASEEFSQLVDSGKYIVKLDADFSQIGDIARAIEKCGNDTVLRPSSISLNYDWGILKIYPGL